MLTELTYYFKMLSELTFLWDNPLGFVLAG